VTPGTGQRAAFHRFLDSHQKFLLTTHVNPDGDGLGSEVALALWLKDRGKSVAVLNDSPVPAAFTFLSEQVAIEVFEPELAETRFAEADALVVLDTSNRQRIGRLSPLLDGHIIPVAIVDHHVTHQNGFGQVNVIEPHAAATGEIVFDLLKEAAVAITPKMAEALYVALATDTGSFKYSNTDPAAHRMAAELLATGIDSQRLNARISAHATAGRLRFFGEVLSALETLGDGRVVVLEASPEQFAKHGLVGADTEGLVDLPRTISGVDVVCLISEADAGRIKVSMRSTGRVAIDGIATELGGGGHPHAAGVLMRGTRAAVRDRVLPRLLALVDTAVTPGGRS
jgi:phosphoesterase RecJ-like protein